MSQASIFKAFAAVLLAAAVTLQATRGQGTLFVSNLGQTPTTSGAIGSDAWIAQIFLTGTNPDGYALDAIQLAMGSSTGTPSGFTVSIYSKVGDPHAFQSPGDFPRSTLGELVGPDPSNGGTFTFTASGILLAPSTWYFLVTTAGTSTAQGSYYWSAVNSYTADNGFVIDNDYFGSANGSSWTWHGRQAFQMAIYATAVPEPSAAYLIFLAGGVLLCALARKRCSAQL